MRPAEALLSLHSATFAPYEAMILDIDRVIYPPSIADYASTIAKLLDLKNSLGNEWEVPIVSTAPGKASALLELLSNTAINGSPTKDKHGLTGKHPIWATLEATPIGWNSASCLLALSFFLGNHHQPYAARRLRDFLRTLDKPYAGNTRARLLAAIAPANNPIDYYLAFRQLHWKSDLLQRFLGFRSITSIEKIPQIREALADFKTRDRDDDAPTDEPTDIYSAPLSIQSSEAVPLESPQEEITGLKWVELNAEESADSIRMQFMHAAERHRAHNALYLEKHVSGLVRDEAKELAKWLMRIADKERPPSAALVAILMLILGRDADTAYRAIEPGIDPNRPVQYKPFPGTMTVTLPSLDSAFRPSKTQSHLYLPAAQKISLPIPKNLNEILARWTAHIGKTSYSSFDPRDQVSKLLSKFRLEKHIPAYLPQLQRTLGILIYQDSGDPVVAQWLTGDFNSHSDAPHYYLAIPESIVQDTYTEVIWPIIAPDIKIPKSRRKGLIGAKSRVHPRYLAAGISRLGASFKNPNFSTDNFQTVIERHNQLATYVTALLVVLAGHRPVNSLLRLHRWDFDLEAGLALFSDKQCDPAHLVRPVALGTHLTEQLRLYNRHLEELHELAGRRTDQCKHVRQTVRHAQRGHLPLFFWLAASGKRRRLSIRWWNKRFREFFPGIQPNFGRTLLASQFRELAPARRKSNRHPSAADLAHIQLGHLELSGQPFGSESPTYLLSYAKTAGPIMDDLFHLQGWNLFGGLVPFQKREGSYAEQPAEWLNVAAAKAARAQMHRAWKARTREARRRFITEAKRNFGSLLLATIRDGYPELAEQIEAQLDPSGCAPRHNAPITLNSGDLSEILSTIKDRKDRSVLTNILEDILQTGKNEGWYSGPMPRRYAPVLQTEQTAFLPGMFAARHCFQTLRRRFYDSAKRTPTAPNIRQMQALARLIISLILYGGVTERSVLLSLVNNHARAIPNPVSKDGILVPLCDRTEHPTGAEAPPTPTVWALWHLAAVSLLHYGQEATEAENVSDKDLASDDLESALDAELSTIIHRPGPPKKWLTALIEQAKVVACVERSGIGSFALDPARGSWALRLTRQYALLSQSKDEFTPAFSQPSKNPDPNIGRVPDRFVADIKQAIPKTPTSKVTSKTATANQKQRQHAIRRIQKMLKSNSLSLLERAIGEHAIALLEARKTGGDHYAFSTTNLYFGAIADRLAEALKFQDLSLIGQDEYVDIYSDVIDAAKHKSTRNGLARELIRFHATLQRNFGAPPVAKSELTHNEQSLQSKVDARISLPDEVHHTRKYIEGALASPANNGFTTDSRIIQQARLLFELISATGMRTGEAHGLHHRDIYVASGKTWLLIRRNAFRSIKSRRAKRRICLSEFMDNSALRLLKDFIESERIRINESALSHLSSELLFSELSLLKEDLPSGPSSLDRIRNLVTFGLRSAAPDSPTIYQLRHTLGTRAQAEIGFGRPGPLSRTRPFDQFSIDTHEFQHCSLPVHIAEVMRHFGHASSKTTNRSYGHLPWVFLHPQAAAIGQQLDMKAGYFLLGKSNHAAARARSRHGPKPLAEILVQKLIKNREPKKPRKKKEEPGEPSNIPSGLPPAAVYLIDSARKRQANRTSYGVSDKADHVYRKADELVAACTGLSFFDPTLRKIGFPRVYRESVDIFNIVSAVKRRPAQLHRILVAFLQLCDPLRPGRLRLPESEANSLQNLVTEFSARITLEAEHTDSYKQLLIARDQRGRGCTKLLTWTLSLCGVLLHGASELNSSGALRKRPLF